MSKEAKIVDIALRALDAYRVLAIKLAYSQEWKQEGDVALQTSNDLSRELSQQTSLVDGDYDA